MKQRFFKQYPKITLATISFLLLISTIFLLNFLAGTWFGLGKVIIYEASPIYGYRPIPNQVVARNANCVIKINNLGLRADSDWDMADFLQKILFLGDSVTYGGSYITNEKLFSALVGKHFPQYQCANAGVNGWGINNVHAFIKEMEFLPAQVYVSVFLEGDFYRGLNRLGGQPYWTRIPSYPLEELYQFIVYQLNLKKAPHVNYAHAQAKERSRIVDIAVRNLKNLDNYLKLHDRDHIIFITPSRAQLLGLEKEDDVVKDTLKKYDINVIYLQDLLITLPKKEIEQLYHDEVHLSEMGHQQWANIIALELKDIILQREKGSLFVQNQRSMKHNV